MTRLVLGSASAGRLSVLRAAGVDPVVIASDVDEDAVIAAHAGAEPAEVVRVLAVAKAEDVAARLPADVAWDGIVIGCDSMLLLDGQLSGKPGRPDRARAQWQSMAGKSGQLLTGHAVLRTQAGRMTQLISESSTTTVHFGTPTAADLDAYVASGEPLGVAGAFTLDGLGGWFIEGIEGDPSNVIGISLPLTRKLLSRMGVSVSQLWSQH